MHVVTTVEDVRAGECRGLVLQRSRESAVRMFEDAVVRGEESMLRRYPEDFRLLHVGNFSEITGRLEAIDPVVLVTADSVIRRASGPADVPSLTLTGGADGR